MQPIILFALAASLSLIPILVRARRRLKLVHPKSLGFHFCSHALQFLIPFAVITSLYVILAVTVAVATHTDAAQVRLLLQLEETSERLRRIGAAIKLNALQALVALIVIYFLGFALRLGPGRSQRVVMVFDRYRSIMTVAYITLVIAASYTFFGTQLGDPSAALALRIKTIRQGYADLASDVRNAIAEQTAKGLYEKAVEALPDDYREALNYPRAIEQRADSLRTYYHELHEATGVSVPETEQLLADVASRAESATDHLIAEGAVEIPRPEAELPNESWSYGEVNRARTAVATERGTPESRVIELLRTEGGKRIACEVPKVFTGEVKRQIFQGIFRDHPILEPAVDVFFRTLDKHIGAEVQRRAEQVAAASLQTPSDTHRMVNQAATEIVEQAGVPIDESDRVLANERATELRQAYDQLRDAEAVVFRAVEPRAPTVALQGNLSVDVTWSAVPGASSYLVYVAEEGAGTTNERRVERTTETSITVWPEHFPTVYDVSAVRGEFETRHSGSGRAALLPSFNGTRCEICGKEAVGFCHIRQVYVCEEHNTFVQRDGGYMRCPP